MKIIAITTPEADENDVFLIRELLRCGISGIHFRKPDCDISYCRNVLQELTESERARIIIHDYPDLYEEFALKGIHVNRNITSLPEHYTGFRTRSCHSLQEVIRHKDEFDYVFLSPIFDSISKAGYKAGFTLEELEKASIEGIIDEKVVALGGVTLGDISYLKRLHFGGVAMIGGIYCTDALKNLSKNIRGL